MDSSTKENPRIQVMLRDEEVIANNPLVREAKTNITIKGHQQLEEFASDREK